MLASSATEAEWLVQIPNDRPTLVIAEGVLEYFTFDEVKTLFNRLLAHFEKGEIIFDIMNKFAVNAGKKELKKKTGTEHKWVVDDTSVRDCWKINYYLNLRIKSKFTEKGEFNGFRFTFYLYYAYFILHQSLIDSINPHLKKIAELPLMKSEYMHNLPPQTRKIYGLMALIPLLRDMLRLMRYQF